MYRKIALMTGIFAVMSFTAHAESSPNILGLTLGTPYCFGNGVLGCQGVYTRRPRAMHDLQASYPEKRLGTRHCRG